MDEAARLLNIRVENNIIKTDDVELKYTDGLGTVLFRKLKESKDKIFQIDGDTGKIDTYGDYLQRCIRTAIAMRARGITQGDIITVCSSNHLNTSVPIIASYFIGAIPANTDPSLPVSDTIHLLKLVQPKLIFVSTNAVQLTEGALKEMGAQSGIVVFGDSTNHTPFSHFLKELEEERDFEPYKTQNLDDVFTIFFSSGSTGLAKGVCLSHSAMLMNLQTTTVSSALVEDSVCLSFSLAYWGTYTYGLLLNIFHKMTRLILSRFESNTIWDFLEKYKVKVVMLSPTQTATILEAPHPGDRDLSSVSLIFFGGSTFSEEQMIKLRNYVPNAISICVYGSSELGSITLSYVLSNEHDLHLIKTKPTACGRPLPNNTYKVVDPDSEKHLGPNQEGELRIKSKYQMTNYYQIDSSAQWDADGFFKTGDVSYYDEDYCFYIVGRFKEMIKYQGWQITPIKLEAILKTHPAVQDVVVVGIPHPIDVEHPAALVLLKTEYKENILPEEIKKYFEEKVENMHKLRGGLKFVEQILTNPAGKVKRREMLKLLLADKI